MSMLEWNEGLSIGVSAIDVQHKKLVEIVNRIHDGILGGEACSILGNILTELKNYAVYHFSTEEEYMARFDYPDINAHKSEHQGFVSKFLELENSCKIDGSAVSMDIMNFLSNWLVTHILDTDKKLGTFLQQKHAS